MSVEALFLSRILFIAIPTIMAIVLVIFFPVSAGDGRKSRTLTGLMCTTAIIFLVVVMDTSQDRPPQHQVSSSASSTSTSKKRKRSRKTKVSSAAGDVRAVAKEKYSILFALWFGFAFLYLLSHRNQEMADMMIRMTMAVRGKHDPYSHSDPYTEFIVRSLQQEAEIGVAHDWALRAILAKQGKVEALGALAPPPAPELGEPGGDDSQLKDEDFDPPSIMAIPEGDLG